MRRSLLLGRPRYPPAALHVVPQRKVRGEDFLVVTSSQSLCSILTGQEILPDMDPLTQRCLTAMVPCETGRGTHRPPSPDARPRLIKHATDLAVAVLLERPLMHAPDRKYYAPQLRRMVTRELRAKRENETRLDYLNDVFSESAKAHVVRIPVLCAKAPLTVASLARDRLVAVGGRRCVAEAEGRGCTEGQA